MIQDTITFEVDLNDRDEDGRLMASRRFASSARTPDPGDRVWVYDDEGNGAYGYVDRVEDLIVYIDLDRATLTRSVVLGNLGRYAAAGHVGASAPDVTSAPEVEPELVY